MTRTEAITIITAALATVDERTLASAAAHITKVASSSGPTADDIQEAFAADSALPRQLTAGELALIEQSKQDFRLGRTRTLDESMAYVDAELERRHRQRTAV
jgi:hypothetical protein